MFGLIILVVVMLNAGNSNRGGRLSTVDLLIKVAGFVKKVNVIFNLERS
jgi:hypothetical protein